MPESQHAERKESWRDDYLPWICGFANADGGAGATPGVKQARVLATGTNDIAELLSNLDAELAALEQRRDKTRALKQGKMQDLLTGRTRLV